MSHATVEDLGDAFGDEVRLEPEALSVSHMWSQRRLVDWLNGLL
jgi:hypothetical protein